MNEGLTDKERIIVIKRWIPKETRREFLSQIEGLHGAGETGEHRSHQRHRTEDGDQEVHQPVHPAWRPQ